YLPQVTASGAYTYNELEASIRLPTGYDVQDSGAVIPPTDPNAPGTPTSYFLHPQGFIEATIQEQHQLGALVEARQALLVPELWAVIRNAYRIEDSVQLGVEGARRAILFATAQAYYGVASLRTLVEASERLLEIARRQERDAQIRLRAGTIAKVGLVRAEIERARAEQDLRRARNGYLSAKIALGALLDRDDLAFEVAEAPPVEVAEDLPALEERALRDRTDVKAAKVAVEIAGGERARVVARYLPSVAAFGRYQWANVGGFTGENDQWAAGVGVQWNVFDGGLREAQLRSAGAKIAEAEAALASARRAAVTEVRKSVLDWQSARANAEKAREQRDLAAENLRLVDVSYKAGAATALEQADATTVLRNAEIALQGESLQARIAGLRVLQAAGASDPLGKKR
ncbi:MAG TPA: TolC family protein, partial [Anaeromyxobacteraceae bacterium]|nr:TolC family protein [Anaeromyxobacteraceae bacterium]